MAAPFVYAHRVRTHECDHQGIVFNANWFAFFDVAMTELWREAFGSYRGMVEAGVDTVVVEASARFRSPARYDEEVEIAVSVERIGTTSLITPLVATRGQETLVEGRLVHVFVDPTTIEKLAIPDRARDALQPYVTG